MSDGATLTATVHSRVGDVPALAWDRVVGAGCTPFQSHRFLALLESSGCVSPQSGWEPAPITITETLSSGAQQVVGVCSAYIKRHSMGEFVYDFAWADAAERIGCGYYPKLVVAAPFSPIPGARLHAIDGRVVGADAVRRALLRGLRDLAEQLGCHSVNLLFCSLAEVRLAESQGFAHRLACQYHWRNEGYRDFQDFLERFPSKKRKQIRRERRRIREAGIDVRHVAAEQVTDAMRIHAERFYGSTVDRYVWGRRYLNSRFFDGLWATQRDVIQMTLAEHEGAPVGGTLNLEKEGIRFGRYWGADGDVDCLHFEVCAYAPIEDCIARGVQVFQAGAGGRSHKMGRGFLPAATHSAHLHLQPKFHDAIADFCRREALAVAADMDANRLGPFKG